MLSTKWNDDKLAIFARIVFLGLCLEDITDRLLFNNKEIEINDIIMIVVTLVVATVVTFKKQIKKYDLCFKIFNNKLHGNNWN